MSNISSMTGSGHAQTFSDLFDICIDLRSVNNRFFDFSLKSDDPKLQNLYSSLREQANKELARGKIECSVVVTYKNQNSLCINEGSLQALKEALAKVKKYFEHQNLKPASALEILSFPGVLEVSSPQQNGLDEIITKTFAQALKTLKIARALEGEKLKQALEKRLESIEAGLDRLGELLPKLTEFEQARLKNRLLEITKEDDFDPQRLEQEIVIMAGRDDIQEEYDRLRSHVAQTREILKKGGVCGKRLDFLMQEFNREANTIASKTSSLELTLLAVDFKVLIEQMREQVQNLE